MKILIRFLLAGIVLALVACTSKINQANFEKVQPGMSMQQVVAILGEPTSVESFNIAGLSGTSAVWQTKNSTLTIQFLNNQVKIKTFGKSDQSSNSDSGNNVNP